MRSFSRHIYLKLELKHINGFADGNFLTLVPCAYTSFANSTHLALIRDPRNRRVLESIFNLSSNALQSPPYVYPVWPAKRSDKQPTTCSLPPTVGLARETTLVDSPGSCRVVGNDTRESIIPQEHSYKKQTNNQTKRNKIYGA